VDDSVFVLIVSTFDGGGVLQDVRMNNL